MFNRNTRHTANAASGLVRTPQLRIVRQDSPPGLKLNLLGDAGIQFDLEYTTNFEPWRKLTELTATGGWTEWIVPPPKADALFLRVVYPAAKSD